MSYNESNESELLSKILKKLEAIEKELDYLRSKISPLDFEKLNKKISIELYEEEKKLKEEEKAEKFVTTFFKGRFQVCEICGKFKFIEKLTNKHAICNACYEKYIKKGISIEDAKRIERGKNK